MILNVLLDKDLSKKEWELPGWAEHIPYFLEKNPGHLFFIVAFFVVKIQDKNFKKLDEPGFEPGFSRL